MKPENTCGYCVIGFETWYTENFERIKSFFTNDMQDAFGTLEDFAVELFFEVKEIS